MEEDWNPIRGILWGLAFAILIWLMGGLLVLQVWAEPIRGYDILGLAAQDTDLIVKELPGETAIGVLEGTFGPVIPKLKELLKTGKVPAFRAHLSNGPCARAHNCEAGEPSISDMGALQRRAANFSELAKQFPGVKCYLSWRLEYDETNTATIKRAVDVVRKAAPNCTPVLSVSGIGKTISGALVEKHGSSTTQGKADIRSGDGNSLFDDNSEKFFNQASVLGFAWVPRMNLRTSGEKSFIPPSKRTATLNKSELSQLRLMLSNNNPVPSVSGCQVITGPEINKTNGEDYNTGDPRSDKLCLILNSRIDNLLLFKLSGQRIGCLKHFGPIGNQSRHYIGTCSGQTPSELFNAAGGEWLLAKGNGQCFIVNAIHRQGTFL